VEVQYREIDPFWRMFMGNRVYRENVPSVGSGFIISKDGYVITNDHVAGHADKIDVTMTNGNKVRQSLSEQIPLLISVS